MGKNNKAQRTKNNARPSSSGRSAELLNNAPPMLFGFTAVKDGAFSSVTLDDMDATVDPNFQMILKKMSKKDSTTKMKALQEFAELVDKTEAEALKAVLPFWPRVYCLLAADGNHRVRESLHRAQLSVVRKAGRNIAPHLKQMIGPWFAAQHDMYPPAASAATTSFEQAFAQAAKQVQAIEFCQAEILAYVRENLLQNITNKQVESEEESRQQRALLASLQGYTLYLQKLPAEALLAASEENAAIVQNKKFHKLAKHPVSLVRASWFSCMATLCDKSPHLLTSEASLAVLSSLDDADSTVLPLVWDAALHLITKSKDVWSHVSVDKLVLPKLWLLLRSGCNGCAAAILPCVLPFISQLPPAVTEENAATFYEKLFDNFRQGFCHKSTVPSQSECNALAKCYVECCRYAVLKNQSDTQFCQNIVEKQLVEGLSLALTDSRLHLLSAPLHSAASLLLHHWDRCLPTLPETFWSAAGPGLLAEDDGLMSRRVELLLAIKCPREQRTSSLRVTFNQNQHAAPCVTSAPAPASPSPSFSSHLATLSTSLCLLLAPLAPHTALLARLAASCASAQLFAALAQPHGVQRWLCGWLEERPGEGAAVVKLAIMALNEVGEEERSGLLNTLAQRCPPPTLCCLLRACISTCAGATCAASAALTFLRGAALPPLLTQLAEAGGPEAARTLVLLATSKDSHGELLISASSLSHLVTLASSSPRLELAVSLVEAPLSDQSALTTLTLALFAASLRGQGLGAALARGASGVAQGAELMGQAGTEVNNYLQTICKSDRVLEVNRCADSLHRLLSSVAGNLPAPEPDLRLATLTRDYLDLQAPPYDALAASFTQLCESGVLEMHSGQSDGGKAIVNETESQISERLDLYFAYSLLNAKIVARMFPTKNVSESVSESEAIAENTREESEEELEEIEVFKKPANREGRIQEATNPDDNSQESTNQDDSSQESTNRDDSSQEPTNQNDNSQQSTNQNENPQDSTNQEATSQDSTNQEAMSKEEAAEECRVAEEKEEQTEEERKNLSGMSKEVLKLLESHVLRIVSSIALSRSLSNKYASTKLNFHTAQRRAALETVVVDMLQRLHPAEIQTFFSHMISVWQDFGRRGNVSVYGSLNVDAQLSASQLTSLFTDRVSVRHMKKMDRQVERCWDCFNNTKPYDVLNNIPAAVNAKLLYDCDVSDEDTGSVATCAMTAQYLSYLVSSRGATLSPAIWDFIYISVASWMLSVRRSRRWLLVTRNRDTQQGWLRCHRVALLCVNTCKLLAAVKRHLEQEGSGRLLEEWEAVFQPELRDILCQLFTDACAASQLCVLSTPVLHHLDAALRCTDVGGYSDADQLTDSCLLALRSRSLCVQYTAFHLLVRLSKVLASEDAASEDSDAPARNLHRVAATLVACQPGVTRALTDIRLGEQTDVEPHSGDGSDVIGYLLAAHVVLEMCDLAHDSLTSQYAQILRESDILGTLLRDVIRLMPARVLEASEARSRSPSTALMFSTPACTLPAQAWTAETIHHLACRVYWLLLSRLPAEVRSWWSGCDQRTLVERITTRFVSPALSDLEMQQVKLLAAKQVNKYDNMKIKVRAAVREVTAVYTVDEASMELVIALPSNHPLGLVKIETPRNVVGTSQCRTWLMQLTMFLTCQNGSLWNGLSLWKSNLDKRFEGIEECYICFSVLSGSNFQLPRVTCRTCKKKFHSSCLFKWFSTSNKSTCPICRNLF